jgi:cytochrome c553
MIWRQSGEGAMMNAKQFAAIAVLFAGASLPALAQDQKPAESQEHYKPRLNLMMVATQLGHFKLWYAGVVQNWPLADYELAQIRASIDEAVRLYPNSSRSDMRMMAPATNELEDAIRTKDAAKFSDAYSKLTAACNSCHEAAGLGFIRIRDPRLSPLETSPFSDESFSGK